MITNGTDTAHQSACCHKTRCFGAPCPIGRACPYDGLAPQIRPVGMAGGIALEPTPKPVPDLTAAFMALAGSHMATTKVLARLVRAARWVLGANGDQSGSYNLLTAVEAAEKDLGL